MNKFLVPFIAIVALFSFASCSTKFNVAAPYKNITVIYGMLDQSDTAHYIRIQKAFLDNNKNALTMAQNPDSNFYASLNVTIARINYLTGGGVHDTIHLNRVDLDLEGYPKQPGVFFNSPNYAYKFTNTLDPNYTYRIYVTNYATGEVDSAEAPVIVDNDPNVFNVPDVDDSTYNRPGLDFTSVIINPNNVVDITGTYTPPGNYLFYGQTSPVGLSELVIRFNWLDSNISTHAKVRHYYDYDFGFKSITANAFDYPINNVDMYGAVRTALGTAQTGIVRLIDRCTLFTYLSTPDYSTYEQIQSTQGTGLTGNEIEPVYTNCKGANVLGLFTSKAVRVGIIGISDVTIDSLIVSPLLAGTNLQGKAY